MKSLQHSTPQSSPEDGNSSTPIEARLQLAAIVDSSDDAIISKDLNGIITSWNAAATQIFGYIPEEIIGRSVLTLIPGELRAEEPMILRKMRAGERIEHYETKRVRKDGILIDISLTISPIRNAANEVVGISKIARDITDRKRTESALIQSERLAVIGRMSAAIAHEVNNPLEAILNLAFLLSENPSLDDEGRGYARVLLDEVVRVSEITKRTLSFYRETSAPEEVSPEAILETVLKLHRPLIYEKTIQVITKYSPVASIWAHPGELRQVFTNLIVNAVDALPKGGTVWIRVSKIRDCVCVTIADNGEGIPDAVREKIFRPFFSTKQSKGNGLGLWVSRSIVRKYGGDIRVRSSVTPGKMSGTVFRVTLPFKANHLDIR